MDRRHIIKSTKKCSFSDSDSNNTESCKVISKPLLPEELIFDILTFVHLSCLVNSARFVCKTWAATIASSSFAEAYERRAGSKCGLYVENITSQSSSYFLEFKNDDVNGQFERFDLGTHRRMGNIAGSCNGMLLLSDYLFRQLFVVNPILKCWIRIPPFPYTQSLNFNMCKCITCVPGTAQFKLFLVDTVNISGAECYVFYVLRIGIDNSWKEIARREAPRGRSNFYEPMYSGGNYVYWMSIYEVIVMDVDKEIFVREYPLPMDLIRGGSLPIYLCMGNRFSFIAHKDEYFPTLYEVFILDFDSGKWDLYHEMGPFDYVAACGHDLHVFSASFCLWINDHIVVSVRVHQNLSVHQNLNMHFAYNVKTRQLKKIEGIGLGNFKVWLHTNSLASLPSSLA